MKAARAVFYKPITICTRRAHLLQNLLLSLQRIKANPMKRAVLFFAILAFSAFRLPAQVNVGIPSDVFYLMPEMTSGTLRFTDRFVNGKFNICAVVSQLDLLLHKLQHNHIQFHKLNLTFELYQELDAHS